MNPTLPASKNGFQALRGLSRRRPVEEQCELCGIRLDPEHPHLLEREKGRIRCACDACALLFFQRGDDARFLRIPRDIWSLAEFRMTDAQWQALMLPIDLAFILESSAAGRPIAFYPSPAGATESVLTLEAWEDLARDNPVLHRMHADVEALLINRARGRREYYIAPLDECYKLTGLIRTHWRGLSGGDAVWEHFGAFFDALRERAVEETGAACA